MAARYEAAQTDPQLLELRAEVSLIDARLTDVLTRVDTGESGRLWREVQTWNVELDSARASRDADAIAGALTGLQDAIRRGRGDWAAWDDVRSLIDQRRRLVESERKRQVEAHQMITVDRLLLLVGALVSVVRESVERNVTDLIERRRVLAAASDGIARLVSGGSGEAVEPE